MPCLLLPIAVIASPVSELHLDQAILAINDSRLEEAVELLDRSLQADPGDYRALYLRGSLYLRMEKPRLAQEDLLRVKRAGKGDKHLNKQIALSWLLLGRNEYAVGNYGQALNDFRKTEMLSDVLVPAARIWQARSLERLDRSEEAVALLSSTLENFSDNRLVAQLRKELSALNSGDKKRPWSLKLKAGLTHDSNIGLFPKGQTIPAGISNRADTRSQFELESSWTTQHGNDRKTTYDYRLFKADYLTETGYNLLSQTLSVDHRVHNKSGYWGGNYQYILADLDSFGQQISNILSAYYTNSSSSKKTSLAKIALATHDYSYIGYQGYSGTSIEALYRIYSLGKNLNDKFYYGGLLRQANTSDAQYSNTAVGLEVGTDRVWEAYHYGASASMELRNYPQRSENHTEILIYSSREIARSTQLESGIKIVANASSDTLYNYDRNMLYIIVGWRI